MPTTRPAQFLRADLVALACGLLCIPLLWLPFYREAYARNRVTLWSLRDGQPRGFWIAVVELALVLVAGLAALPAARADAAGRLGRSARAVAIGGPAAALVIALVIGFIAGTRIEVARVSLTGGGTGRLGIDLMPTAGWVIALVLAALSLAASLSRPVMALGRPEVAVLPQDTVTLLLRVGGLLSVVAAFTPVYQRVGQLFHVGTTHVVLVRSVLHDGYAVAAVVLALASAVLSLRHLRLPAFAAATFGLLATLAAGAAMPVDDGVGFRVVNGVVTYVSATRLSWGYGVLLAGAVLLFAGTAFDALLYRGPATAGAAQEADVPRLVPEGEESTPSA